MTRRQLYVGLVFVLSGLLTIVIVNSFLGLTAYTPVLRHFNSQTVNSQFWTTANLSKFDLSTLNDIEFLDNYRNPCWFRFVGGNSRLQCLPYFYIIGAKKSGTTELFAYVLKHPEVAFPTFKESHWFSEKRHGRGKTRLNQPKKANRTNVCSLIYYSDLFESATKKIKARKHGADDYHPMVVGEGTPAYLHKNPLWETFPGNEGLAEPRVVVMDYIRKVTPDAKILLILRDPVDRMFSDYVHSIGRKRRPTPEDFHARMVRNVNAYTECFKTATVRSCVYNNTLHSRLGNGDMNFRLGIYPVYVRELQRVFRRDQLMVILLPDLISKKRDVMAAVFRFLGLRSLSSGEMDEVCSSKQVKNKGHYGKMGEDRTMMETTRQMLQRFYDPFNRELASLLNDDRYLFNSSD